MTEHNEDDKGSTEIEQGPAKLETTAPEPNQAPAATEEAPSEHEAGSSEIKDGPAAPEEVATKLEQGPDELKGPIELMTEAQEAWRKLSPIKKKTRAMRKAKPAKPQPPQMTNLLELADELAAAEEPTPDEADED